MANPTQEYIDTGIQVLREYHEERQAMLTIAQRHGLTLEEVRAYIYYRTSVKKAYEASQWDTRVTTSQARKVYELHRKGMTYAEIKAVTGVSQADAGKAVSMMREQYGSRCQGCNWRRDGWPVCCLPGCAKEGHWADGK